MHLLHIPLLRITNFCYGLLFFISKKATRKWEKFLIMSFSDVTFQCYVCADEPEWAVHQLMAAMYVLRVYLYFKLNAVPHETRL